MKDNDKDIKIDEREENGDVEMAKRKPKPKKPASHLGKSIKKSRDNAIIGVIVGGIVGAFIFWLPQVQNFFIENGIDIIFEPIGAFIGATIGGIIGLFLGD